MPKVSAIVHVRDPNDRLGRTLQTLHPCDEIIVINHSSDEETAKTARQYGANVRKGIPGVEEGAYVIDAKHDWILCVRPDETLSEGLEAALFEWKDSEPGPADSYVVSVREQTKDGWREHPAEARLVNRKRLNWKGEFPPAKKSAQRLEGDLLRFTDN